MDNQMDNQLDNQMDNQMDKIKIVMDKKNPNNPNNSILFTMKVNKTQVGTCYISDTDKPIVVLEAIEIRNPFKNKGYGTKLLIHVIDYLKKKKKRNKKNKYEKIWGKFCPTEEGNAEKLVKWYEKNGFVILKQQPEEWFVEYFF